MKKAILIAAALAAAAPLTANAQSPDAALERLNEQIAESPEDAELLANRGRLNFLLGNYDAAAADLWKATQADTAIRANAGLQIMRGRAVLQSGKPDAASRVFESIQGRDSEEAQAAFYAAEAYSELGEDLLARAALERAIALNPDFRAAQVRLDQLGGGTTETEPEEAADEPAPAAEEEAGAGEAAETDSGTDMTPAEADAMLDLQGPSADAQEGDEALLGLRGDAEPQDDAEAALDAESENSLKEETLGEVLDEDGPVSLSELDAPEEAEDSDSEAASEDGGIETDTLDDLGDEAEAGVEIGESGLGELGADEAEEEAAAAPAGNGQIAEALAALRATASDAPVESLRQDITQARANGNTNAELRSLRDLYIREAADRQEITRYAELVGLTATDDAVRDFRLARLAELARHTRLAAALYGGVEQSGDFEGRNLAIVRGNLATQLRILGNYGAALEAADAAIEADEDYANAWAVKGLILRDQGDSGEALPVMKEAYERGARAPELLDRLRQAGMAVDSDPAASPQ